MKHLLKLAKLKLTLMFNSSDGYQIIKKEIGSLLRIYGFLPYKTATYYRVTDGDILQFIMFQKGERWLSGAMTVNIVIQGVFAPGCSFNILQPGGRIGSMLNPPKDVWWHCDSESSAASSVDAIKQVVVEKLIPFFENRSTAGKLFNDFDGSNPSFLWTPKSTFVDQGYICLKAGQYDTAINIFEANQISKVPKFKTIKRLIEDFRFTEIDHILVENTRYHKESLKI